MPLSKAVSSSWAYPNWLVKDMACCVRAGKAYRAVERIRLTARLCSSTTARTFLFRLWACKKVPSLVGFCSAGVGFELGSKPSSSSGSESGSGSSRECRACAAGGALTDLPASALDFVATLSLGFGALPASLCLATMTAAEGRGRHGSEIQCANCRVARRAWQPRQRKPLAVFWNRCPERTNLSSISAWISDSSGGFGSGTGRSS